MAINIKFTKFDNTPWGFRLAGGSDFPQPLTVIRVAEGSLAECMGLKVGDVVVRLNDQPISNLSHGQAHEALLLAGNNFTLGVHREEDPLKAVEGISEDNIVPYKIPLDQLPPVYPEKILLEESSTEVREEETLTQTEPEVVDVKPEEEVPEKPKDANSDVVPNQNLTDDEIAQLILEEEELLIPEQGVLGVNFKKLRPRLPNLKESKVVEELQSLATEDPPRVKERKHVSTFLQKPQRPIPQPRTKPEPEEPPAETYKVVIKKQEKKSVTKRLLEKGLLHPGPVPTPEYRSEVNMFVPNYNGTASEIGTSVSVDVERQDPLLSNDTVPMDGAVESRHENPSEPLANAKVAANGDVLSHHDDYSESLSNEMIVSNGIEQLHHENLSEPIANGKVVMNGVIPSQDEDLPPFLEDNPSTLPSFKAPIISENIHADNKINLHGRHLKKWINKSCFKGQYFKKSLYWFCTFLLNVFCLLLGIDLNAKQNQSSKKRRPFKGHYFEKAVCHCWDLCSKFLRSNSMDHNLARKKFYLKGRYSNKCFTECRDLCLSLFKQPIKNAVTYANAKLSKRKFFRRGHYLKRNICWYRESGLKLVKLLYPADRQSVRRPSMRMRGHYFETCLRRDSVPQLWLLKGLTNENDSRRQSIGSLLSNSGYTARRRSSCSKAHYGERILLKNVKNIGNCFHSELCYPLPDSYPARKYSCTRRNSYVRGHYAERVMAGYLENLGLFILKIFERRDDSDLRVYEVSCASRFNLGTLFGSMRDTVCLEIFHRGSRKLSRLSKAARVLETQSMSLPIRRESVGYELKNINEIKEPFEFTEKFTESTIDAIECEECQGENRQYFDKATTHVNSDENLSEEQTCVPIVEENITIPEERNESLSVIDGNVTSNNIDENTISQFGEDAQSSAISIKELAEFSNEVRTHDSQNGEDDKSPAIKQMDFSPNGKTTILANKEDFELPVTSDLSSSSFSNEIQNTNNNPKYSVKDDSISSNSLGHPVEKSNESSMTDFIRVTKDYISMEVFHRGGRRLSRSSRSSIAVPSKSSSWLSRLWHFGLEPGKYSANNRKIYGASICCEETSPYDRETRRLSFVPTILYEGITSRIGIDFTKLLVYGFVPCTSLILLYAYKSQYGELAKDVAVH